MPSQIQDRAGFIVEKRAKLRKHNNLRRSYQALGKLEEATIHSQLSIDAQRNFYLSYKQLYPHDVFINNQFAQVYYLCLARHLDYVSDPEQQTIIKRTIASFLSKFQQQTGRQHVVFERLRDKVASLESTQPAK